MSENLPAVPDVPTPSLEPSKAVLRLDVEQIRFIANTEFVPKAYRNNLPGLMACIAYGRELGLGDMEALRSITVIDGKPSLGAETMVRLVRKRGHSIQGEFADGSVTVVGTRLDNQDTISVTWTKEMAERAKLIGKDNWAKYPESMLWARAVSQLCRMLFADCLAGLVYTPDEAELSPEDRVAEAIGTTAIPETAAPDDSTFSGGAGAAAGSSTEDADPQPSAEPPTAEELPLQHGKEGTDV